VLSKDSVTVAVDAVVYYRVMNATASVINVNNANRSTQLLAQTTLRNVLGTKNLSEILSDRENISHFMQVRTVFNDREMSKNHNFSITLNTSQREPD
jgi:erythrocyte band 7 integral membrane protein